MGRKAQVRRAQKEAKKIVAQYMRTGSSDSLGRAMHPMTQNFINFLFRNGFKEISPEEKLEHAQITRKHEGIATGGIDKMQQRSWNNLASIWKQIESLDILTGTFQVLIKELHPKPNAIIASVGSGPGFYENFFAKDVWRNARFLNIDISENMSKVARNISLREKIGNIYFRVGAIEQIPLRENSADLVLALNVLQWVHDWRSAISEMKRVIKKEPESRIVIGLSTFKHPMPFLNATGQPIPQEFVGNVVIQECERRGLTCEKKALVLAEHGQVEPVSGRTIIILKPNLQY